MFSAYARKRNALLRRTPAITYPTPTVTTATPSPLRADGGTITVAGTGFRVPDGYGGYLNNITRALAGSIELTGITITSATALTATYSAAAAGYSPLLLKSLGGDAFLEQEYEDTLEGTCTLEQFGAAGDGVTSDQAAFVAAKAALLAGTYGTLLLGAKTYLIQGITDVASPWPMGVNVVGQGSASVLKTATNGPVFLLKDTDAADRAKNNVFFNFRVEGNSTGTSQNAIEVGYLGSDGAERVRVIGCTFNSLGGRGVSVYASANVAQGPQVIGCKFYSCLYGVYGADQVNIDGCQFTSCTTGVYAFSGNVNISGGSMVSCTTGLHVAGGGNDGHGTANGVQFLHCTTPLRFGAVTNGHLIDGCLIYEGTILFDGGNAGAIVFQGGLVDATVFTLVGKSRWVGVTFDLGYYSSSSTTGGDNEFTNCRDIDGTVPAWIAALVQPTFTYPSDANAILSAQESRAELININAGVISAGRDLTSAHAPAGARSRQIVIRNNTAQTVTYKWSSGTGVAITTGIALRIGSDGTNAIQVA